MDKILTFVILIDSTRLLCNLYEFYIPASMPGSHTLANTVKLVILKKSPWISWMELDPDIIILKYFLGDFHKQPGLRAIVRGFP
jgi:hypothetical protein